MAAAADVAEEPQEKMRKILVMGHYFIEQHRTRRLLELPEITKFGLGFRRPGIIGENDAVSPVRKIPGELVQGVETFKICAQRTAEFSPEANQRRLERRGRIGLLARIDVRLVRIEPMNPWTSLPA